MFRPHRVWLVPAALTLVSLGSNVRSAVAQTTYEFRATYDVLATTRATVSGSFQVFPAQTVPEPSTTITLGAIAFTAILLRCNLRSTRPHLTLGEGEG